MSELPETMFRTTTFDDSTDEHLTPVKMVPIDEAAEDEYYANWEPMTWARTVPIKVEVEIADRAVRLEGKQP